MLNLLTDRSSKFVRVVEIAGLVLFPFVIYFQWSAHNSLYRYSVACFFALYLLLRFCATWNWYRKFNLPKPKDEIGIRVHLKKTLVATSYVLLISNALLLKGFGAWVVWIACAIFVGALYVNLTLIYMHLRDSDKTPPNFFSRSFLGDVEALEEDRLKNFFPKPKDLV